MIDDLAVALLVMVQSVDVIAEIVDVGPLIDVLTESAIRLLPVVVVSDELDEPITVELPVPLWLMVALLDVTTADNPVAVVDVLPAEAITVEALPKVGVALHDLDDTIDDKLESVSMVPHVSDASVT